MPNPSLPDAPVSANPALADLSPRDKPWDKHRANADKIEAHYRGSEFSQYATRVSFCSQLLEFGLLPDWDSDTLKLKLRSARFCRVRHCPVCQWRRSLMWKAKAYKVLPKIVQDYPGHRWLFLTLTVKNVEISELKATLQHMNRSFQRLSQRRIWPAEGWLRSTEVTRGRNGTAHPHFHCLLMVCSGYFGKNYINQDEWVELWRDALRVDYNPILDCRAVKRGKQPMQLVPELLKYCTKESDLVADREWFLELTRQMHKMKCITTGGVLKEYLKELEAEPEDLIGQSEEPQEQDEAELYFAWQRQERRYRMLLPE
ncbi:MAG: protein rep [Coleofasciculus sp. C3-bin4]|nr:protein rep [Coleofasciculus sp. C3-bin4]